MRKVGRLQDTNNQNSNTPFKVEKGIPIPEEGLQSVEHPNTKTKRKKRQFHKAAPTLFRTVMDGKKVEKKKKKWDWSTRTTRLPRLEAIFNEMIEKPWRYKKLEIELCAIDSWWFKSVWRRKLSDHGWWTTGVSKRFEIERKESLRHRRTVKNGGAKERLKAFMESVGLDTSDM